jgi:formylmethanofuran dehydrogenase subunit E
MLPLKPFAGKANSNNTFSTLFGDNGREIAIRLLSDALKTEKDADIKTEIERRIKLLDPKESTVKCSKCKKDFSPRRNKKYAQYLCDACLAAKRYSKTP